MINLVRKYAVPALFWFVVPFSQVIAQDNGCSDNPRFNDFDFWVGQWQVSNNMNGEYAGSNTIEKQLNNCLVMESWQGATGSIGKSMNYFNPLTDQWRQVWVAPGYVIDISGGLVDGAMALFGTIDYFNDNRYDFRGSWTPADDGSVRQFFEQFDPDSESWTPWFDGRYERQD